MKLRIFWVAALATLILSSCKWESQQDNTPDIYFSAFYCNPYDSVATDTTYHKLGKRLKWAFNEEKNAWVLDTIQVGDTVYFATQAYSYTNNLVSFEYKPDTVKLEWKIDLGTDIPKVVDKESELTMPKLIFPPAYNLVSFGIGYKAREKGEAVIKSRVVSDSQKYPERTITLIQPIR